MKIIILLLVTLLCKVTNAQYNVTSFQDMYEEIKDFNSIAIETFGDLYWEKEFELPYIFPYFDSNFELIKCDVEGTCRFEDDIDFSLRLLTFGYMYDNVLDTINIESDVRYKYGKKEGKDYLVIQFTKNRLFSDTSVEEFDSHVNFQYWFFDDGTIELRFGPSNLDNSPVYVPGEGFYLLTDQGPIPSGPQLALYHPYDEDIKLEYNDLNSHEEYELNTNGTGSVDWWPPDGWVIRFTNKLVFTNDLSTNTTTTIFPNPTNSLVSIDSEEAIINVEVYSSSGKIIVSNSDYTLDLSNLDTGIYYLRVLTKKSLSNHKILKL